MWNCCVVFNVWGDIYEFCIQIDLTPFLIYKCLKKQLNGEIDKHVNKIRIGIGHWLNTPFHY